MTKLSIFIYKNTFYIGQKMKLTIKVNGNLEFAFSISKFNYL